MIKTKIIQIPKGRLLVVDLPEGASNIGICRPFILRGDNRFHIDYNLPSLNVNTSRSGGFVVCYKEFRGRGNYPNILNLLGKLPDIKEKQAKEVVQKVFDPLKKSLSGYKNYNPDVVFSSYFDNARESLFSLVEHEVPLKNELGDFDEFDKHVFNHTKQRLEEWKALEEKVFRSPVLFWEAKSKEK